MVVINNARVRSRRDLVAPPITRERVRGPQPTDDMVAEARKAYDANKAKNRRTSEEKASKKKLGMLMAQASTKIRKFSFLAKGDQGPTVDVEIADSDDTKVDMDKLVDKVGLEQAISVATTSQDAVMKAFGSNILNACLVTVTKPDHLTIKERK